MFLHLTGLVDNELPRTTTRTGRLSLGRAQPPGHPPHSSLPSLQELHSSLEQGSPFPKPDSWTFSGQRAYSPPSCCRPLPPWASGVEAAGSRGEVPGTQPKELRAHGMESPSTSKGSERTPPLQITGSAPYGARSRLPPLGTGHQSRASPLALGRGPEAGAAGCGQGLHGGRKGRGGPQRRARDPQVCPE